jgi:stress-induced morphogen
MPDRADRIAAALTARFAPSVVRVIDDSARHAGHAGAAPGGETHYSVLLVAEAFQGVSRVARSRAVHEALAAEFAGGLHALALTLRTPQEQAQSAAVRSPPV